MSLIATVLSGEEGKSDPKKRGSMKRFLTVFLTAAIGLGVFTPMQTIGQVGQTGWNPEDHPWIYDSSWWRYSDCKRRCEELLHEGYYFKWKYDRYTGMYKVWKWLK